MPPKHGWTRPFSRRCRWMGLTGLGLMGASLALPAFGEEAWPTEQDYFMDLPVALTATRLQQPLIEAPASVTVIDRHWISHSQARDIHELLRMVPGVVVGSANGGRPIVTYHGFSEQFVRQLQVLVDGRSIYTSINGGTQWGILDLTPDDIERIEVIRGPNAAAYGSNSFFAIINILTRHSAETQGNRVSTRLGSNGVRDLRWRYGGDTEQGHYRVAIQRKEDDGFPDKHDQRRIDTFSARSDWNPLPGIGITTQLGLGQSRKGIDGVQGALGALPNREFTRDFGHLHLQLQDSRDADTTHRLQYYFQFHDLEDDFEALNAEGDRYTTTLESRAQRHDLELESSRRLSPDSRVVYGGSARLDRSASSYYFDDRGWIENEFYRVFGHWEWSPTPQWLVNLGGMYEYNDITKDNLMPRAAVVYMPHPEHSLRLVASRATRTPSLAEEEINIVDRSRPDQERTLTRSQGGLEPEVIHSLELGYHGQFADGRLTTDVKLFRNQLQDLIQVPYAAFNQAEEGGEFRNIGGLTLQGLETQWDYRPTPRLRLLGGFALLSTSQVDEDAQPQADSIPGHTANLGLMFTPDNPWTLTAEYYHYGSIDWLDDPVMDSPPLDAGDGFLDLHVSRTLGPHASAALSVRDVLASGFDSRVDGPNRRGNRRSTEAYLSLSLEF
ncbi:TonB-dependent siderophore receptor [Ectothiorhodospira sp. BSL-9]|uniref:TonB-dependent receptor plug domain-containing protein n=1 Tax=Ectothiorhodospira sp. BSL-9 TaxID=1442136 RepID=UPI00143C733C|nr:TonB-dependent receptor [Ectothiorhodospira sp. BSL-9]